MISGNTTNFMHHIELEHGYDGKQIANQPKQQPMSSFINVTATGKINPERHEQIDDALCKFIAGKQIPISTEDNDLFRVFIGLLDPRLTLHKSC